MRIQVGASESGELQLLKVLRSISELEKKDEMALGIMERVVEIDPSDVDVRFYLAYRHSERGNNDIALFHYLMIPLRERNGTTWNNLGVAFDNSSLVEKSVDAYREAEQVGETLAMSNLALKLMGCESRMAVMSAAWFVEFRQRLPWLLQVD